MVEFGSDFHRCDENYHSIHNYLGQISSDLRFYANGRLIFDELIKQEGWKRIWIPDFPEVLRPSTTAEPSRSPMHIR